MCWGSAGWASVLRHRGEWSRSVSSIPNGAGAEWCYECGAFLCGSQRMEVVEGQWVLLDTTNGGGVYGAVRQWWFNLQWVQWFWINLVVGLVMQRAPGCGGWLSGGY